MQLYSYSCITTITLSATLNVDVIYILVIFNKNNMYGEIHQVTQGSYGSWKTWKDLEFYSGIFQE